LKLGLRFPVF